MWATIHKETGAFIGRCGLLPWRVVLSKAGHLVLDHADEVPVDGAVYEVEVAYLLAKESWGQGLGSEAARAIVEHGFDRLRVPRLICLIDDRNEASLRVARNVGMTVAGDVELEGETFPLHAIARVV